MRSGERMNVKRFADHIVRDIDGKWKSKTIHKVNFVHTYDYTIFILCIRHTAYLYLSDANLATVRSTGSNLVEHGA